MSDHAVFSASGSSRWMNCAGSLAMEQGLPNDSSIFAEEGTLFHDKVAERFAPDFFGVTAGVPFDMIHHIMSTIQLVNDFTPPGAIRLIETRVDFSRHIGVPDSFGTLDVGIIHRDEICVLDHKYGMGVQVDAENNSQLMLYALGLMDKFALTHDFKRVRLVINQPRLDHLSEWTCSVEHLLAFATRAKKAAAKASEQLKYPPTQNTLEITERLKESLTPGTSQCKFCRAKVRCPALRDHALNLIADDFVDLDNEPVALAKFSNAPQIIPAGDLQRLSTLMKGVPLVEIWIKSVREAVFQHLANGNPVPSFKMVRGKQGNRKWKDDAEAEKAFKAARIHADEMYDKYIISPTAAEKLLKDRPRLWSKINEHVTRAEGKLSVAPESDKREAVAVADISGDFENLEGEE